MYGPTPDWLTSAQEFYFSFSPNVDSYGFGGAEGIAFALTAPYCIINTRRAAESHQTAFVVCWHSKKCLSEHKTGLFELQWADGQSWHRTTCRTRYKGEGRKKLSHPSCPTGPPHHSLWDGPLVQMLSGCQVGPGLGLDIRAQAWNEGLKQIKVLAGIIKTSPKRSSNQQSWTFS